MINMGRGDTGGIKETMQWLAPLVNIDFEKRAAHSCQLKVTVHVCVCINKA